MSDSALSHRLAAILAADAAGYSRLMAIDDQATVAALDAARAVFRAQIEAQHGRVIDMAGDSVLAVFGTAAGAVAAALANGAAKIASPAPQRTEKTALPHRVRRSSRSVEAFMTSSLICPEGVSGRRRRRIGAPCRQLRSR